LENPEILRKMEPTGRQMVEISRCRYAAAQCQNIGNPLTPARFFDLACSVFMQVEEPTRSDFHTCRCSIRLASCFLFCFFSVVRLCFSMFFFLFPGLFFLSFRRCFSGSSPHFPLAFFGYGFFGWLEIFFASLLGSFGLSA